MTVALAAALSGACGGGGGGSGSATYTISGKVSGATAEGVSVSLSGATSATTTSDASGAYAFRGLSNGAYTVTPSKSGFTFDPGNLSVTVAGADADGRNFAATAASGSRVVSGTVSGAVAAGVTVTLTDVSTWRARTLTTGDGGTYSFDGLGDGVYLVAAAKGGYAFDPASVVVTLSGADATRQDFSSAAGAAHAVTGTISGPVKAGVLITMTRGGGSGSSLRMLTARTATKAAALAAGTSTSMTNADGTFTFQAADGSYQISPSKPGFTFDPPTLPVTVNGADVGSVAFAAAPVVTTYTISGTVTGAILEGVSITLTGAKTDSTTTDAGGKYSFSGLEPGSYSVTPSKDGYAFNPVSASGSVSDRDVVVPPFVAAAAPGGMFTISGNVSGAIKAGVTIALDGVARGSTVTDADGAYAFRGLLDGTYTLRPSKDGYAFDPPIASAVVDGADVTGKDFVATGGAHSISGKVSGAWVEGVTVKLGGAAQASTNTDSSGRYRFEGLMAGTYTVEPSLPGYAYAPPSAQIDLGAADVTQDFAASSAVTAYAISGTVTYGGTMTGPIYLDVLGENWSGQAMIGAPGAFTIRGLPAGDYKIYAFMDVYGVGYANALVPQYSMENGYVTVTSDVSGVVVALAVPNVSHPPEKPQLNAFPGNGSALLSWESSLDYVSGFRISWGTDAAASNGGQVDVSAEHMEYVLSGLTDGQTYHFKVAGLAGQVVGEYSDDVGVTIGGHTGGFTLSGHLSFSKAATGPAYVVVYDGQSYPPAGYLQRIENPANPQAYSISGLAAGMYAVVAGIDMNGNGIIDPGEPSTSYDVSGDESGVNIGGDTTLDLELLNPAPQALAHTHGHEDETSQRMDVELLVNEGAKHAVSVTLVSGKGIAVPCDLGAYATRGRSFELQGGATPSVGDEYRFQVKYSDGSVEMLSAIVSGIVDFARNLAVVTDSPSYSATVPLFTWADPSSPPASFTYGLTVAMAFEGGGTPMPVWTYPWDGFMPSTQHQVQYDADGRANAPELTTGQKYVWTVTVRDASGNSSTSAVNYTTP